MTCPRCGQADALGPACPRCGVVFAKLAASRPRPRPAEPAPPAGAGGSRGLAPGALGAGLLILAGLAWLALTRLQPPPPAPAAAPFAGTPPAPEAPRDHAADPAPPPPVPASAETAPAEPIAVAGSVAPDDVQKANALILKHASRQPFSAADLAAAEDLHARYASEPRLADVLAGVLVALGNQEKERRRFAEAHELLRRAVRTRPESSAPRQHLIAALLESGDYPGAEAETRDAIALSPRDAGLHMSLAYALFRQDRNREALDAVEASLAIAETPGAAALRDRLLKARADERGMTEQQLAHFHVRYDGDAHEDVGREILRQLERHHATLVRAFDHQPGVVIPVILFSREAYFDASGAPAWSGGVFDGIDGRIRIPIGGLTASLTPEMDATLVHELTHAFVNDITRGLAPRALHEGIAQYMEGKRIASRFTREQLAAIADGRAGGVGGFYAEALAFVEYLVSLRGTGGINDLLRAMGETGQVDAAFARVHGSGYAGVERAWRERLRQQYGS